MDSVAECLKYIKERLFFAPTGLLYDDVIDGFAVIPTSDEITADCPTPNGNGTVMEDCMITGGTCLHGLCIRMERTGGEESDFAEKLADGMLKSASSGKNGFVPRGVSPTDGVSHYRDCSRDQMTMFCYGLLRYAFSGYCSESIKKRISAAVQALADRAERNVSQENEWNILTEDGKSSQNGILWGEKCKTHEFFRLPQIFLSAYALTGKERYYDLYLSFRDEALRLSRPVLPCWAMYCLQQMAVSIDTARRFDKDESTRILCGKILNEIADCALKELPAVNIRINSLPEQTFVRRTDYVSFYNAQDAAIVPMLEAMAPGRTAGAESIEFCIKTVEKIPFSGRTALPVHFFTALEMTCH